MTNQPHRLDSSPDGEPSEESEDRPSLGDWLMESLRPPPPPVPDASDAQEASEPGEDSLSEPAPRDAVDALSAAVEAVGAGDSAKESMLRATATGAPSDDSAATERAQEASLAADPEEGEASFNGREDDENDDSSEAVLPILPSLNGDSFREDAWDGSGDSDSFDAAPEALGAGAVVAEELAAETSTPDTQVLSDDGLDAREDGGAEEAAIIGSLVPPPRRVGAVPLVLLALLIVFFGGRWVLHHRAAAANHTPPAPKEAMAAVPAVPASPEAPPVEVVAEEDSPPPGTSASGSHRRGTPPDVPSEPSPQYGPSVARFPDLPRSVLIELERAATPADPSATTD